MILGIDEVGRGPWAGPLVVGAVVLGGVTIDGLTDSKKLTKKRREALSHEIYDKAAAVGLGWVHANEIDEIGLSAALTLGCKRALKQITIPYHEIIIDGTINLLKDTGKGPYVTTMKKADLLVPCVSAASIVAKVARDEWMAAQDDLYPGYHFKNHVGYGTTLHREAITTHGLTPLHRRSFAPIAALTHRAVVANEQTPTGKTSTSIGIVAETIAADWLMAHDFTVVERNWKTKFCEIDIICMKNKVLYFVEVKHRRKSEQGGGLAAVTDKKQRQMTFAAKAYQAMHKLLDTDARLAVITTTGDEPVFESWLEVT